MRAAIVLAALVCSSCAGPDPRAVLMGSMPPTPVITEGTPCEVEPWSCLGYEGVCLRTPRWDICTTIMVPSLHERLPVAMEAALAYMRQRLDSGAFTLPEPTAPMTTCLMSDRRQWSNLARVLHPAHADIMEGLSRGGFTAQGVALLYDIDRRAHCRDTMALALHEGWHQYAQTALAGTLPAWIDEGLATLMEGYRLRTDGVVIDHAANGQRARRAWWLARRGRLQPLAEFIQDDPLAAMDRGRQALLDYYAQAWAVMRFMLDDPARLATIRASLAAAIDGGSARLPLDAHALEHAFEVWVRETLRPSWWH